MTSTLLGNLSRDLLRLFENTDEYNVIVEIGEDPSKQSFKAHTSILCYRCPYLYNELKSVYYDEKKIKHIKMPNISIKVFDIIIKYIYSGTVTLEKVEISQIFDLLMSANELKLEELSEHAESYLIKYHASWLRLNFSQVHQKIYENNFILLQEFYNDIVTKHPGIIFDSVDFEKLDEKVLVSILRRDDLQLEESKIWDCVIKWGVAQNPTLPSTFEYWKDKDFFVLKKTLKDCLPHIRFFHIPSEEIFLKIRPYQQILETQLWTDIMSKIMAPKLQISSKVLAARKILSNQLPIRSSSIPSEIITAKHATEIMSWINKETLAGNSCKFKLIWRGENDSFYPYCIERKNLLVIVQVKGTDEILGGFNPIGWTDSYFIIGATSLCSNSFIFSLQSGNAGKSILSRVKNVSRVLKSNRYEDFRCLRFGVTDLALTFDGDVFGCCKKVDYELSIRNSEDKFGISKIEVFQLSAV